MIRINQIKLSIFEAGRDRELELEKVRDRAARVLKIDPEGIRKLRILRRSVDARDKQDIKFVYTVSVKLRDSVAGGTAQTETAFIQKLRNSNVQSYEHVPVTVERLPDELTEGLGKVIKRPVVVGMGPCGLFAGLVLARAGAKPILI